MLFGPIFDYFDPIEGEVPDEFDSEFTHIAHRARHIIRERSRDAIIDAAEAIDELIGQTKDSRTDEMLDALVRECETGRDEIIMSRYNGPAGDLEWCIGRADPGAVMEGTPFRWSELFAVQALGLIAHGWEEWHHVQNRDPIDLEAVALRNIGSYAVDAMEALAKAEMLVRIEDLETDFDERVSAAVQRRVSSQNAGAAKRKHAPQNRVKQRFIRWYLDNEGTGLFHSRAQAADRFFRELAEDERRLFKPTNATRTLLDSLRQHLRQQPTS